LQSGIHKLREVVYLKVILTGISVMLVLVMVFVNIADYALYSSKRNLIARGIDHSVCAAIQEIDITASLEGLSEGYDTSTGVASSDNILLNEQYAENAFFSTLRSNTDIMKNDISDNTLIVFVCPIKSGISYVIKKGPERMEGFVSSPGMLETAINNSVEILWNENEENPDEHIIYVNGNPSTNEFKKVPYFLVFIKNHEISGLFRKRTATFVGFAGAKLERRE
jgi:hypothetical protein